MNIEFLESPRRVEFEAPERQLVRASLIGGPHFDGFDGFEAQLGGIWIEPTASVLGLRAFNDADEGIDPLHVYYELEKVLRMLLRQSPLALRVFASPLLVAPSEWDQEFIEDILRRAVGQQMVTAMLDLSADADNRSQRSNAMPAAWASDSLRWALAAKSLMGGVVGFNLELLARHHELEIAELEPDARLEVARSVREEVDSSENVLSPGPSDYSGLSDWLVDVRKQAF